MPRTRGTTRGKRAPPRGTPRSESHTARGTPGSQSHTTAGSESHTTPGSQSHTTPGSQSHNTRDTPGSESHNTRSTTRRSSHRTTPGTSRAGRIQKNTRNNRTRRQVSQSLEHNPALTETNSSSSQSGEDETSEYRSTPPINRPHDIPELHHSSTPLLSETSVILSAEDTIQRTQSRPEPTLRLDDIRELLQSHEEDIVNRVVYQLNSQNPNSSRHNHAGPTPQPAPSNHFTTEQPRNLTSHRITELENQLAQLRAEQELEEVRREDRRDEPATFGTYNPLHPTFQDTGESASSITESVEILSLESSAVLWSK